jgi:hypothetical protein
MFGLQGVTERVRTFGLASNVIADMEDERRLRLGSEQTVKVGNAEGYGGRNFENAAGIVQSARADPSDAILNGVEHGQKMRAPGAIGTKRDGNTVDCVLLVLSWVVLGEVKVHRTRCQVSGVRVQVSALSSQVQGTNPSRS